MFKQILVISDNILLCKQFAELIKKETFPEQTWSFGVSPLSDSTLFEKELNSKIDTYNFRGTMVVQSIIDSFDLIFSIHCKQLFPPELARSVKCINIHPGYNPLTRGWYPQVFAIINGLPAGATIHEMDEQLDHGKIIDRATVDVEIYDTSETLYNKIIQKEIELLKKNLGNIIRDTYAVIEPESAGNIFLRKDFEALLCFDLNRSMTGLEFINQLRAITHGDHNNAYFLDPATGKKIFMKINLEPDKGQ
jgi:dTDP-4-amino-4,6-dideoxyglucose formyltransferase